MSDKPIRSIAIVGSGIIGASWAALFLARGLEVIATDPAPSAEENLREYIDNAWPALEQLGLSSDASKRHLSFTTKLSDALKGVDLVQENGPERPDFKIKLFTDMDALTPETTIPCLELIWHSDWRQPVAVQTSRALCDLPSLQPAPFDSSGRGGR